MSLPCAAYNFGLLSGSLLCFIVWNPIRKKTKNGRGREVGGGREEAGGRRGQGNKRAVSTKSTRIAIILNPPAGPLRRSSQNVQAHPEV